MSNLINYTVAEALKGLQQKEFSSVELTNAYLDAINKANEKLNAYVAISAEKAQKMAKESDERRKNGNIGLLEGIPLGIKDIFATESLHTQACSKILDGFLPHYESTVTANLWKDGAVCLGKLNMDEFAMGSSNETSCYGASVNPWRAEDSDALLTAGGSSGGSAAAVAAGLCAAATATDTGGSIRQPAAFTATVGLKPTYGRCSRWGTIAFASSLDQAGPITKDVRDAALLLQSMASYDPKDSTSVNVPIEDYSSFLGKSIKGKKIGVPFEYFEGLSPEIAEYWQKTIDCYKDLGAEIVEIKLPHSRYALSSYYVIAPAEASSNLSRYDGVRYGKRAVANDINSLYEKTRGEGFGYEVKRRILIGTYVLSSGYYDDYYLKAQKVRTLIKKDFEIAFNNNIDAILTPSTPVTAFELGQDQGKKDPIAMYLNDIFTVTLNMVGLPGISVPVGLSDRGLPLGMQLITPAFDEGGLLQFAYALEQQVGRFSPKVWW
ncbi:Asp-tRNA(Asn)/Glu-tRNA(Gln) amidotransferase subunit GatA [Bartonella sp. DGB1]|uniref:Asp-tRNA(Asn)/Glu-tRNA(Gln) amidotransferase subunit GatA n=1 Tax=Bartonella sp. DGB1 TaxID=3239807 RepID=UPI003526B662